MASRKSTKKGPSGAQSRLGPAKLSEMIEEATVDAHDGAEQATGWYTMFEEHLSLPFETKMLGILVTVTRLDLADDDRIMAICTRGRETQAVGIADLPLPSPKPEGAEWIEAYRFWLKGR